MKQAQTFLAGEGDAWLRRNKEKLSLKGDLVLTVIALSHIAPSKVKRVLEVGCANGWRLKEISRLYNCEVSGIDPRKSDDAWIEQGTADRLPYKDGVFDLVIYGFCLYLCDREDLFKIVTEGDRVLADGGYIIIHDFSTEHPYKRAYKHCNNIYSYKMNYENLWLANPSYKMLYVTRHGSGENDYESVSLLKKDVANGWPLDD